MYIRYYKEKDTDPMVFLQRFRCTTEPIGGGTEYDAEGELVSWNAAIAALEIARKQFVEKACEWLENNINEYVREQEHIGVLCRYAFKKDNIEQFRKAMEE